MVFTGDSYNSLVLEAMTDQLAKTRAWRETKCITQRNVSLVWSVQFQRDLLPSPEWRAGGSANKHSVRRGIPPLPATLSSQYTLQNGP